MDLYKNKTIKVLKEICKERRLKVSGKKEELINRIQEDDVKKKLQKSQFELECEIEDFENKELRKYDDQIDFDDTSSIPSCCDSDNDNDRECHCYHPQIFHNDSKNRSRYRKRNRFERKLYKTNPRSLLDITSRLIRKILENNDGNSCVSLKLYEIPKILRHIIRSSYLISDNYPKLDMEKIDSFFKD